MRSNPNLPLKQVTYRLWKGLGFPCTKCWEGGGGEDSEAEDSSDEKEMAGREKGKRTQRCLWELIFCKD